jgi:hypothetical protein
VVVLGVVGRIAHQTTKSNVLAGLVDRRGKLGRILRWPQTNECTSPQVSLSVAHDGQLRPLSAAETLVSPPPDVVTADVTALQAGGIDDCFGGLADQLEISSTSEQSLLKNDEGVFFRSRSSA